MKTTTNFRKRMAVFSLFAILMMFTTSAKAAQTAYALWCESSATLYFVYSSTSFKSGQSYDGQTVTRVWTGSEVTGSASVPAWNIQVRSTVKRVVFVQGFQEVKPTSTLEWFYRCGKLESIQGLQYLNTSNVTTMKEMFRECTALQFVDLSSFDTQKVTDMSYMFFACSAMPAIDVSYMNTSNVTNMDNMFGNCSSMGSIEFFNRMGTKFYTHKVQRMSSMFYGCKSLQRLNLSLFDTSSATHMGSMFYGCSAIKSLDLRYFSTGKVQDMSSMFANCSNLAKIICNNTWTSSSSESMFLGCTKLKGAIAYDPQKLTVAYANPTTGYFYRYAAYGLYIDGIQVDTENCDNISSFDGVDGTVTFDPQTKKLTLDNASITATYNSYALSSTISGLTIAANGMNVVRGYTNGMQLSSNTTITAADGQDDHLQVNATNGAAIHLGNATLNVNGGLELTARGNTYGISGFYTAQGSTNFGDIVVGGKNTVVYAFGSVNGCITLAKSLTLNDGLTITNPENASFQLTGGTGSVCDASGTTVKNQNVIIQYVEPVEEYDLYICGTRVTSKNCASLRTFIDGIQPIGQKLVVARYSPQDRTLSLSNVAINSDTENCIVSSIQGLTILVNDNVSLMASGEGKSGLVLRANTTLKGARGGSVFWSTAKESAVLLRGLLSVENIELRATGGNYGIQGVAAGRVSLDYQGAVSASNKNTVIKAYGESGSIYSLNDLILKDGLQITEPENATFSVHSVRVSRRVVSSRNVVIQYVEPTQLKGDVNLDGKVDISDIVAVINTIAGDTTYVNTSDVNEDQKTDISDIVAIINIIAEQ